MQINKRFDLMIWSSSVY